jgi:molybdopterin molybdotransferase
MQTLHHALSIVIDLASPLGAERLSLPSAAGRRLAAPVRAAIDAPRGRVSTMDGYAVRSANLAEATPLRIIGEARPGYPHPGTIAAGEAVRLFTGAPIPEGADRVVMQERGVRDGDLVTLSEAIADPVFVRARASDFAAGDVLLAAGTLITPGAIIAAAGADIAEVDVWRQPRVSLLATGDELVPAGSACFEPYAIPDSLTPGLVAAIVDWGGAVIDSALLPDHLPTLRQAAARALAEADVVVVTGGASVGAHDHARAMFGDDLTMVIDKVAVKPGKPVWLARAREGGPLILGLPGNPGSAYVTARLFLAPLLTGLAGGDPAAMLAWADLPLRAPLRPVGDRDLMTRARQIDGALHPLDNQDSGAQAALALATHLIWQRAGSGCVGAGEFVRGLTI